MKYFFSCISFIIINIIFLIETECIFVFGGCSQDHEAINNCFILDTESWKWSEVIFLLIIINSKTY